MSALRVGIIGAGAAGTSAASLLHDQAPQVEVEMFARTGEQPANRTLVTKGVMAGLLTPDQAALPDTGAQLTPDTVRGIEPRTRELRLDSGATRTFDALLIASGSRPRQLDEEILGRDDALRSGRLTTLHSMTDGARVRDRLSGRPTSRVLLLGGGLVASETASLLTDAGHDVALITRSLVPGANAIGAHAARRLLNLHHPQHAAYLGSRPRAIRSHPDRISITLDRSRTRVDGDLAIVAHGTLPAAPAPWTGPTGIPVDSRLRSMHAPRQRIYAAGGVAVHHYPGHGSYRIDHWDDSTAQGAHAARALLHDLGLSDDPGVYLPSAPFSVRVHGHTLSGVGHPMPGAVEEVVSTDPFLAIHRLGGVPVAVIGIDAAALVREQMPRLHQGPASQP